MTTKTYGTTKLPKEAKANIAKRLVAIARKVDSLRAEQRVPKDGGRAIFSGEPDTWSVVELMIGWGQQIITRLMQEDGCLELADNTLGLMEQVAEKDRPPLDPKNGSLFRNYALTCMQREAYVKRTCQLACELMESADLKRCCKIIGIPFEVAGLSPTRGISTHEIINIHLAVADVPPKLMRDIPADDAGEALVEALGESSRRIAAYMDGFEDRRVRNAVRLMQARAGAYLLRQGSMAWNNFLNAERYDENADAGEAVHIGEFIGLCARRKTLRELGLDEDVCDDVPELPEFDMENAGLALAVVAAREWSERLSRFEERASGPWPQAPKSTEHFESDGFIFEWIKDIRDLHAEGHEMHHCVASYAKSVICGQSTIWRVSGAWRGTLELTMRGETPTAVSQLRGACNAKAPDAAYAAADKFLQAFRQQ